MKQRWNDYEEAAQHGPMKIFVKIMLALIIVSCILGTLGYVAGWFREAATVAQEQFGPRELLRKYEWFKDASAQLDKKVADISVYEQRFKSLKEEYKNAPRIKWSREDREQYNIWQSEASGVQASYNNLAAEYNSEMSKFNWRFTNVGDLPKGADTPLPREYKPYTKGSN